MFVFTDLYFLVNTEFKINHPTCLIDFKLVRKSHFLDPKFTMDSEIMSTPTGQFLRVFTMDENTHEIETKENNAPTKEELRVTVNAKALREILDALVGPQHLIRELQVTRGLPGFQNPIDQLIDEFNVEVERLNFCGKEDQGTNALNTTLSSQSDQNTDHSD